MFDIVMHWQPVL